MFGIGRIQTLIKEKKFSRLHSKHRKIYEDEYKEIDRIIKLFHSTGGLKHEWQAYKLFSLRKFLNKHRPKKILELGSGSSTAILADYVKRNDGAVLTSIDESEDWLRNSSELAGITEGNSRFEMIHAPKIVEKLNNGKYGIKYDICIDEPFDFVLVDGPSLTIDGMKCASAVNTNIFDIANKIDSPECILVDIRAETVKEMEKRLSNYNAFVSDVINWTSSNNCDYRYFSVFTLSSPRQID